MGEFADRYSRLVPLISRPAIWWKPSTVWKEPGKRTLPFTDLDAVWAEVCRKYPAAYSGAIKTGPRNLMIGAVIPVWESESTFNSGENEPAWIFEALA